MHEAARRCAIVNLPSQRDLMAQRLARRAEDRQVPGSSPTQN